MHNDTFKSAIEARLSNILESERRGAPTPEGKILMERIHALVMRGGKRARPRLMQLTYDAYAGNDTKQFVDLGVALELHHQFLLMHDDIIDNDNVRYDGPNIVGYYESDKPDIGDTIPQAMGLLAGDMLFSLSHSVVLRDEELTDLQKVALLQLLNDTNMHAAYGEQLDSFNIGPDTRTFAEERLKLTNRLKTAFYSTRLPMRCAALLLDLDENELQKIDSFAFSFGVLFQEIDDFSDYFVNASAFNNRPKYRDFREGKVTYPLYYALSHASPRDAAFLGTHMGKKGLSDKRMQEIIRILDSCGAKAASRTRTNECFRQTYEALEALTITPSARTQFKQLLASYSL